MASMKTNITMIRNLKNIFQTRIEEKYSKEEAQARNHYNDLCREVNKKIIADITEYAIMRYPHLKKTLKCDYHHSEAGVDSISIYLKVEDNPDPLVVMAKKQHKKAIQNSAEAEKRLEAWEEQAIRSAVAKSDLPPFEV